MALFQSQEKSSEILDNRIAIHQIQSCYKINGRISKKCVLKVLSNAELSLNPMRSTINGRMQEAEENAGAKRV